MGFTKNYNSQVVSATHTLFDITADRHFACWLFLHNLITSGNSITIKIYVYDDQGGSLRTYINETKTAPLNSEAWWSGYSTSSRYRVDVILSAGAAVTINWTRYEAT